MGSLADRNGFKRTVSLRENLKAEKIPFSDDGLDRPDIFSELPQRAKASQFLVIYLDRGTKK